MARFTKDCYRSLEDNEGKEKPPEGGFTKFRPELDATFLLHLKFTLSKKTAIVFI